MAKYSQLQQQRALAGNTDGICVVCGNSTNSRCPNVNCFEQPFLCGKEHFAEYWESGHRDSCDLWDEVTNETLGVHYIAKKDVKPRKMIFKRSPLVVIPFSMSMDEYMLTPYCEKLQQQGINVRLPLTCLGCCKFVEPLPAPNNGSPVGSESLKYYRCTKCQWPLCNPTCEENSLHQYECSIFAEVGFSSKIFEETKEKLQLAYTLIGCHRGLLLRSINPEKWKSVRKLKAKCFFDKSEDWKIQLHKLFYALKTLLRMTKLSRREFDGFFETLASNRLRCNDRVTVYKKYATVVFEGEEGMILPHSCLSNSVAIIDKHFCVTFATTECVKKGDIFTICYHPHLLPFLVSRLDRCNYFSSMGYNPCDCEICTDDDEGPTESLLEAVKCVIPFCKGFLLPHRIEMEDASRGSCVWRCQIPHCPTEATESEIEQKVQNIYVKIRESTGNLQTMQKFLDTIINIEVHENHYLVLLYKLYLAREVIAEILSKARGRLLILLDELHYFLKVVDDAVTFMDQYLSPNHFFAAHFIFYHSVLKLFLLSTDMSKDGIPVKVHSVRQMLERKINRCVEIFQDCSVISGKELKDYFSVWSFYMDYFNVCVQERQEEESQDCN